MVATEEYRKESNTLQEFFTDMCRFYDPKDSFKGELTVPAGILYHNYKEYCASAGDTPIGSQAFSRAVLDHEGVVKKRDEKGNRYIGIVLRI